MRGLLERLVAGVATFGSLVALVISLRKEGEPFSNLQVVLMAVAVIAFFISAWFDINDFRRARPRVMKTDQEIRDYMFKWVDRGGNVAIFSRTLGWVNDEAMREMLARKAGNDELTLVMPAAVAESSRLESKGARAIYYGASGYTIKSRFTIIYRDRTDTAVAIGRESQGKHLVAEFSRSSDDPSFYLAEDLVEILTGFVKTAKKSRKASK